MSKDTIYRQDAIDAINAYLGLSAVSRTIQNMTSIQEILENLPSAQHNWIPIEDNKLPDNVDVLLQFKSNMGVGYLEDGDWAINTGDEIYSFIGDDEEKPIAWMPLPSPYREEADEVEPEIIRCKDCVHYSSHKDDYMCGINVLAYIHENDFCSRAERRTQ